MLLSLVKWPIAITTAFFTPAAVLAFCKLLHGAWDANLWRAPFGIGFCIAGILWLIFRRTKIVTFLATMEHEFTHAIAAWLTFVPVIELRSTDGTTGADSLGHVRLGGSNMYLNEILIIFQKIDLLLYL